MKCAVHAEVDAVRYCRNCGKALCDECKREVRGVVYCEDCLAAAVLAPPQAVPTPTPAPPGAPSPGLALALGFIPGVGAIYNGQYLKGLIHILIFGGIIALLSQGAGSVGEPILGLALTGFIAYMVMDAYRTAKAKCCGMPVADDWALGGGAAGARIPVGPIVLIGIGVLFLLHTFGIFDRLSHYFWPFALILLGVLLLIKRMSPGGQ